jgi:hypothetical protein
LAELGALAEVRFPTAIWTSIWRVAAARVASVPVWKFRMTTNV